MSKRKLNNLQKWILFMKKTPPVSIPTPYPEPTLSDAGKVLSIDASGNPVWVEPQSGLPEIKESDRDKVLVVDSNGMPTWGTTAGGDIPLGENECLCIFKD